MKQGYWITFPALVLVCFCLFLCNPIGVKAEVGDIVEQWEIEVTNEDENTNQTQPTGTVQCEFSEYRRTDLETGTEVEGLALTLTVPNGDYTITPAMMEEISNKALAQGKKIYSMTTEENKEDRGGQILDLDREHTEYTPNYVYRRYLNNNFDTSNNPNRTSQFALIEVDFQVPMVDMTDLFRDNKTLEVIHNLTFSDQTVKMSGTFWNSQKLKQIPDPFTIPANVKSISYIFMGTGLETLSNLTIEDAESVSWILDGSTVSKIENWHICTVEARWLFSGTNIQEMNNVYIKGNKIDFKSPKDTLTSVKGLTLDLVEWPGSSSGEASAHSLFEGCSNLTEAEVTLKADKNVKYLGMMDAFSGTGLSSTPKNFKIPESITEVRLDRLFAFCPNLSSVSEEFIIPKSAWQNKNIYSNAMIFIGCPKLRELPPGFVAPLSHHIFAGCNALTSLPEGFSIGNIEKLDEYKGMKDYFGVPVPMFGKIDYPENESVTNLMPFLNEGFVKVPTIALPLQVDESLKKYQELGEVNFTQKLFFEGLPQDIQTDAIDMLVGATYSDEINGLKAQLETIKNNLENKGYTDISFILKPYVESNPIVENYAKFRSLSTRNVGALDSTKTFDDFITELGTQTMDCDPKVIEVKYSGGVVASTPELTVNPVYAGTDTPYAQTEWTKDNITVNIVAKDDVNGIDKIVITDPNGTKHDVSNTTQGDEFAYGHQIPVADMTTSGEYTYKYQTVNTQGSLSDEISVTIRVDIDKPQASIENGILKATDEHSGVKEIKLPNGTIITWTNDCVNNGYEVSEYGTYEIYDNAGNVTEVIYKATAVTEPAITLAYEKEWTNKDVMVEVTITNADEVALLELPDGTTRVLGDGNTFTTTYLVTEEGEKDYRFAITKKTREEGNLVETAHIKLDKTAPTSSIVTVNGKNYLKASDNLSGVSHLISPSGKTIMWLPEYEQNGYQIAEDGTYQVYDRAGNNGEQYGTQIKEEVVPIAPIPTIPSFPEENKTEPETDKKTEDKKEPETDKKTEDKKEPETDKKTEDKKEPEIDKKTEDKKEPETDKKTEDKKESKPDKKPEDKTTDKQSKEDGTLEYSKTPETPTDVEIKLLTPDGKIETIYIPKEKVYLLESGETIFGRDIGYPFIDRIYYGGKGRPIIVGLNGEEYQCLNVTPVSETVMSDSKHGTLVGTSNTTSPKTGDNIIQVLLLFMFSGVLIAGVSIRNRRKTMK